MPPLGAGHARRRVRRPWQGDADSDNEGNDNKDNDADHGNILEAITTMIEKFDARMHGIRASSQAISAILARLADRRLASNFPIEPGEGGTRSWQKAWVVACCRW